MVLAPRLSWSGGQHGPAEATSKPALGDTRLVGPQVPELTILHYHSFREHFTFLVPLRFQQSVASVPAPLPGGRWKYSVSHEETNLVAAPKPPNPNELYLFGRRGEDGDLDMEDGSSGSAYPPLVEGVDQNVGFSFCGSILNDSLLTANVSQLGDLSGRDPPGAKALISEYSPSTGNCPQFSTLDASSTNAVDVAIDLIPVRPKRLVSADTNAPPIFHFTAHVIEDTPVVSQASRQAEPNPHLVPQPTPQPVEEAFPPIIKVPATTAVGDPPIMPIEGSGPSIGEGATAPTDAILNPSSAGGPAHPPVGELTHFVVEAGPSTADEPQDDEEQDEQDEMIVDALLAVPLHLNVTSNPHSVVELGNAPQEQDGGSGHTPTPKEVIAGPTKIALGSTSCADPLPPSTTQPLGQDSKDILKVPHAPFRYPRSTNGTTIVPLSDAPLVQESATRSLNPLSVLEGYSPCGDTNVTGLGPRTF